MKIYKALKRIEEYALTGTRHETEQFYKDIKELKMLIKKQNSIIKQLKQEQKVINVKVKI